MGNEEKDFKDRFQSLLDQAKELISKTSDKEIQEQGIVLIQPPLPAFVECKTEEEFGELLLKRIHRTGKIVIPQHPNEIPAEEIMLRKQEYALQGIELRIPALIAPHNPMMEEYHFRSYLVIFTHDGKLFIHPNEGDAFLI